MKFFFVFFISLTLSISWGYSQDCPKTKSKKALGYFKDAGELLHLNKDLDKARVIIQKAIDEDPEYAEAYLLAGYLALKKRDQRTKMPDYGTAIPLFEKAVELCETVDPDAYYILGKYKYDTKKYQEGEKYLNKFLTFDKLNEEHAKKADTLLIREKIYMNPVPFDPKPVQDISTHDPEYLPYISPDNELAFFTRSYTMQLKGAISSASVEKFMIAFGRNGVFDKGSPMDPPFNKNSGNNEGGATITVDNNHLFFTVNNNQNFDIYSSDRIPDTSARRKGKYTWSEPKPMGPNVNDPKQWDSQPSVSPDGKTLYFSSLRDSVTQTADIYVTHQDENGNWSKAQKLPSIINTNGNEKGPFIHGDGKTLYFSSDSLPGLGGYDIFMSKKDENGKWGKPVNLGYPINTEADEVGFFVSTDGKTAYFASNAISGNYDIFSFDLYPKVRPDKVYLQKGEFKADTKDSLISATIEIKNTVTQQVTKINVDSVSGKYAFLVNFDNDLMLTVKKDGYAFESQYVSAKDSANTEPVTKDIEIQKIEVGKPYTINDILFSSNSYIVNDTIKIVLTELADYLRQNPNLHVALQGHTDNVGSDQDNLILSENRAKTVYQFLISRGINKTRISFKGYGASAPIATNSTEEGRARNRRIVFVVMAK